MTKRWVRLVCYAGIALPFYLLLCSTWRGPDLFVHLALGRGVLEHHTPQPPDALLVQQPGYVNVYWLFQLVCAALYSAGGVWLVDLFFAGVWTAALVLWLRTSGLVRAPALGAPLVLAATILLQERFQPRPEVVSYLLLAALLHRLSTWDLARLRPRDLLEAGVIEAVWANVHGYFVLGPILVLLRVGAARKAARLAVVVLLASLASPFTWKSYAAALALWRFLRACPGVVTELASPLGPLLELWTGKLFACAWLAVLVLGALGVLRRRLHVWEVVTLLIGLSSSALSVRNIPLLVLFAAPALRRLTCRERDRGRPGSTTREIAVVAATACLAIALSAAILSGAFARSLRSDTRVGFALPPHAYATRFRDATGTPPLTGRIFNDDADGGFLEYSFPACRPYIDSRYVDPAVVREYVAALGDPGAFARLDAQHHFDGVLLESGDPLALPAALLGDPAWHLVHGDLHRLFFVRAGGALSGGRPGWRLDVYRGEDISRRENGYAAIQWVALLLGTGKTDRLRQVLSDLATADEIPSYVVEYSLDLYHTTRRPEDLALARRMYPKMIAWTEAERSAVELKLRSAEER